MIEPNEVYFEHLDSHLEEFVRDGRGVNPAYLTKDFEGITWERAKDIVAEWQEELPSKDYQRLHPDKDVTREYLAPNAYIQNVKVFEDYFISRIVRIA